MTFHEKTVILYITLFNNEFIYDIDKNTFQMRFAAMIKPVPIFLYRGDTAAEQGRGCSRGLASLVKLTLLAN
ncbi:MAG TPA: hypothetical protein VKA91_07045 [Nitrososphaeraceae archaeon]|nr:hypothetical protein [Nitrososphaeraceae archaeon]